MPTNTTLVHLSRMSIKAMTEVQGDQEELYATRVGTLNTVGVTVDVVTEGPHAETKNQDIRILPLLQAR